MKKENEFRVCWKDGYPKKNKKYHKGSFSNRQKARQWCRNNVMYEEEVTIIHPDGKREIFEWQTNY